MFDPWNLLRCINAIRELDQCRADGAITRRQHRKQRRKLDSWYESEIRNWADATGSQYRANRRGDLPYDEYWAQVHERDAVLVAMEPEDRSAAKKSLGAYEIDYYSDRH